MKNIFQSPIITIALAIFSMLFGAGNLIYPLLVGINTGNNWLIGMSAFLVTAIFLPLIGLIAMILFDGNYEAFFKRLGNRTGALVIFICMLILGPLLVIPRITTLSHIMITPFIAWDFLSIVTPLSSLVFATLFLGITFLCTYKENKIVELLGNIISPLLLLSLMIIIVKGVAQAQTILPNDQSTLTIIKENLLLGYGTLDLLGTIFFCAIVLIILRSTMGHRFETDKKTRIKIGFQSGLIGVGLLAVIYFGMGFLGAHYGAGLEGIDAGSLFREISLKVLGAHASIIIAVAVLLACLSTAIALSAVCAEYVQKELFNKKISFVAALLLVLASCIPLSIFGLKTVLQLAGGPITYVGYPVLITLTLCNIAYKTFGFTPVKVPVLITFIIALASYIM